MAILSSQRQGDHVRLLRFLPALILILGLAFTLVLQASIIGEAFLSGDAGVKFLLTRNYAAGRFEHDVHLRSEPWAERLWSEGLFPLEYPARVRVQGREMLLYSFVFPLLSAGPYRLLGIRGLYLLPLVTTWLLWWSVLHACRVLEFHPATTSLTLVALIFGSPLTYYSATFWEHAPAWLLAGHGLLLALVFRSAERPSKIHAYLGGLLLGLSTLLREEMFVAVTLLALLAVGSHFLSLRLVHDGGWILAGLLSGVLVFGALNYAVYRHPLGVHAAAALASQDWAQSPPLQVLRATVWSALRHFPLSIALIPAMALLFLRRGEVRSRIGLALSLLSLGILIGVPIVVRSEGGRQWGPRYVLIAVPLIVLVMGLLVEQARGVRRSAIVIGAVAACVAWGIWVNAPGMTRSLFHNYAIRAIPLNYVRALSTPAVAVSHQYVTQQLVAALEEKPFFLTKRPRQLRMLAKELYRAGYRSHLFLYHTQHAFDPFRNEPERVQLFRSDRKTVAIDYMKLGYIGRFAAYKATILSED